MASSAPSASRARVRVFIWWWYWTYMTRHATKDPKIWEMMYLTAFKGGNPLKMVAVMVMEGLR